MFRYPDSKAKRIPAVNWKCQDITLGDVEPTLSYSQNPFLSPPGLEHAQTNKEVDLHILQRPNTTPCDDNIHQNLLQKETTSLNNLSPFIFHGHEPSFAKPMNRLPVEKSPYTEIPCVGRFTCFANQDVAEVTSTHQGNEPFVDPTHEQYIPLASYHSLLSDFSFLAQGRHSNPAYGTTPVGKAPRDRHTDDRTTVIFSDDLPMSSTSSSQALGRSYGQDPCFVNLPVHHGGPVTSSSQPVCAAIGQHAPLQCRSVVQIYKEVVATSPDSVTTTTNRGDDEAHHSTRYWCDLCNTSFYAKKGLNRHIKDKHSPWNTCPLCSNFQWPKGRRYSFKKHLRSCHKDDLGAMHEVLATIWFPNAPRNA